MDIKLPRDVEYILNKIEENGFEAYIVGGCVRDSIMSVEPQDWDITTNALPKDIKKIFGFTIDTGIKHGTVSVLINSKIYEITTYRIDGEYIDGRHPEKVEFTTDLAEDLLRRDFTINAMAYSSTGGLVDLYGGIKDIEEKRIKCVGIAYNRFLEDSLRILRAIRFSAKLDFSIEEETFVAMKGLSKRLKFISKERIREELVKTLISNNPIKINLIKEIGADDIVFNTKIEGNIDNTLSEKILSTEIEAIKIVLMCEGLGIDVVALVKYLKFSNNMVKVTKILKESKNLKLEANKVEIRRFLYKYGSENASIIVEYLRITDKIDKDYYILFDEVFSYNPIYKRSQLMINGNDLKEMGVQGEKIGIILDKIMDAVIENQELNTSKEKILEFTRKLVDNNCI